MTDYVNPGAAGTPIAPLSTAESFRQAGVKGWVVRSGDSPTPIADFEAADAGVDSTSLGGEFDASWSSSSLTVSITNGEGFVAGYLARDTDTTVTLPTNTTVTVDVGWDASAVDNDVVIIEDETDDAWDREDPRLSLWEFTTDGSGVTNAVDLRPRGPTEAEGITTFGREEARDEFLSQGGGSISGDLTIEGGDLIVGDPDNIRGTLRTRYLGGEHGGTSTYLRDGDGTAVVRIRNGRVGIGADPSRPASGYAGHIQGDAQVDGSLDVDGETTTDHTTLSGADGQVTTLSSVSHEAGFYVGPWSDDGTDGSVSVELADNDYALGQRSTSISYHAVPSFVFREDGGFDAWDQGRSQIFGVDSSGNTDIAGNVTVDGTEIAIPNADGNEGLQLSSGAAFSMYNDWATAYSYSGDGGVGFRVRNPDEGGNMFTVDNVTGDGWFRGTIVQDGNDVVDSADGHYEIQVDGSDGSGIINFKTQ